MFDIVDMRCKPNADNTIYPSTCKYDDVRVACRGLFGIHVILVESWCLAILGAKTRYLLGTILPNLPFCIVLTGEGRWALLAEIRKGENIC